VIDSEIPSQSAPQSSSSRWSILGSMLKWFVPLGIITAFFTGLGSASFCLLFCSTTGIEGLFIWLGIGSIILSLVVVPLVCIKKIFPANKTHSGIGHPALLVIIGYIIVFGITFAWAGIGGYKPQGWQASINEKMLDWIQITVGNIRDAKREAVNKSQFNNSSFEFVPTSSELTLINSHDAILSLTGKLSGLDKLVGSKAGNQYNLVISEAAVGDMVSQGSDAGRLKGEHGVIGDELFTGGVNIGMGDSEDVTTSITLPKEFAQKIKDNPNTNFKIKLELLALSPYTYGKFNFTSLWSQVTESVPKYAGQFLKDLSHEINFRLPDDAVKYTKIDENGNFVTESDNQASYSVTTKPKLSLCCEAPEFKVVQAGNGMSVNDYLNNVSWRNEIISKKVIDRVSFQLGIIEARPSATSPYKAIIYSRYGEVMVYELTGKNSGLDELYNLYLASFKKMFPQ
jgi:hypothetical protein